MTTPLDAYDYELPRELVAQAPLATRSDARLLVVRRTTGTFEHRYVRDLPELLASGDRLVLNDTRVVPAALEGYRTETGGRWQGLFLESDPQGFWKILGKTRGKLRPGETVTLRDRDAREAARLHLIERREEGTWIVRPEPLTGTTAADDDPFALLERVGHVPLPHYIRGGVMRSADLDDYQTVFARVPGAVAAPTAGLHFTKSLLETLHERGVGQSHVTLHVGPGTFRPITGDSVENHAMHAEWAEITKSTVDELAACRAAGGRIVAVGSTAVRTLETAASGGALRAFRGLTDLYIHPPYTFRAVDALLTNFHLPRTTLLVLVSAFGGRDLIRAAYEEAVREQYRFFSYGDAMLIV